MKPEHLYTIIGTLSTILLLGFVVAYGDEIKKFFNKKK